MEKKEVLNAIVRVRYVSDVLILPTFQMMQLSPKTWGGGEGRVGVRGFVRVWKRVNRNISQQCANH